LLLSSGFDRPPNRRFFERLCQRCHLELLLRRRGTQKIQFPTHTHAHTFLVVALYFPPAVQSHPFVHSVLGSRSLCSKKASQ
jgi:hypothetical protein